LKTVAAAALALFSALPALAQSTQIAPTITILSPTSTATLFSATFPFTQTVSFKIGHVETLAKVQVLDVSVNNVTIINGGQPLGNPFNVDGFCVGALTTAPNTCVNASTSEATVGVPWSIQAPGTYSLLVSAKFRSAEGMDQETILVAQATVEYPAPPAVANAYINGDPYLGCRATRTVLSLRAERWPLCRGRHSRGGSVVRQHVPVVGPLGSRTKPRFGGAFFLTSVASLREPWQAWVGLMNSGSIQPRGARPFIRATKSP
jgi:hypothetical protein